MFSDEDKDSHRPLMRYTFGLNKSNSLMSQNGYLTHKYHHLPRQESTKNAKITINVSGERYQTYVETLNKFPESLLGNKNKRELFYDIIEDEYFFDRDRNAFNAILYYYQSNGQLYCPLTLPMTILVTEAQFFELGNTAIKQVLDIQSEDISSVMPKKKWQRTVWCLFEHPESSKAAKVMTVFSVSMIVLAVTVLCIETLPFFKTETFVIKNEREHPITVSANVLLRYREHVSETNIKEFFSSTVNNSTTLSLGTAQNKQCICSCRCTEMKTESRSEANFNANKTTEAKVFWKETFDILESVFVTWFTAEFILRLISSPNKKKFLTGFLNVVDILSILPFYFTVAIRKHVENVGLDNFRVLRLVRVFRVFKLSRHSKGLQILGQTMKASIKELGMLIFFIGIGVVLFSSTIYYLEVENFNSIPDAFWWAIITMCTVGYGDMVPKTFWGKIVGGLCSVCGVLSIALPVPVIVSNFDYFCNRERTKKMHQNVLQSSNKQEFNDQRDIEMENQNASINIPAWRFPQREEEIRRQATIKEMEKHNRHVSQKLSGRSHLKFENENEDE